MHGLLHWLFIDRVAQLNLTTHAAVYEGLCLPQEAVVNPVTVCWQSALNSWLFPKPLAVPRHTPRPPSFLSPDKLRASTARSQEVALPPEASGH